MSERNETIIVLRADVGNTAEVIRSICDAMTSFLRVVGFADDALRDFIIAERTLELQTKNLEKIIGLGATSIDELEREARLLQSVLMENQNAILGNEERLKAAGEQIVNTIANFKDLGTEVPQYMIALEERFRSASTSTTELVWSLGNIAKSNAELAEKSRELEKALGLPGKSLGEVRGEARLLEIVLNKNATAIKGNADHLKAAQEEIKKTKQEFKDLGAEVPKYFKDLEKQFKSPGEAAKEAGEKLGKFVEHAKTLSGPLLDFVGATERVKTQVSGMLDGLELFSKGLTLLAANPVLGTIYLIVGALKFLQNAFQFLADQSVRNAIDEERNFIQVSEEMQEKIVETADKLNDGHAAFSMYMGEIVKDANITKGNLENYAIRTGEIIDDYNKGTLNLKQTQEAFGKAFTGIMENAKNLGMEGSRGIVDMILKVRESGTQVSEVQQYVNDKLTAGKDALKSYLSTFDTKSIRADIDDLNNKLRDKNLTLYDSIEIHEQIKQKEKELSTASQDVLANWDFMQTATLATFEAFKSEGKSFIDIVGLMGNELNNLSSIADQNGLEVSGSLKEMTDLSSFVKNHEELTTRVESVNKMMTALGDSAYLSKDAFQAFGKQASTDFQSLINAGASEKQALELLAPQLNKLNEYANTYNVTLDDQTQALINKGRAAGVVATQENEVFNRMNDLLYAIAKSLNADIPQSAEKTKQSIEKIGEAGNNLKLGIDDSKVNVMLDAVEKNMKERDYNVEIKWKKLIGKDEYIKIPVDVDDKQVNKFLKEYTTPFREFINDLKEKKNIDIDFSNGAKAFNTLDQNLEDFKKRLKDNKIDISDEQAREVMMNIVKGYNAVERELKKEKKIKLALEAKEVDARIKDVNKAVKPFIESLEKKHHIKINAADVEDAIKKGKGSLVPMVNMLKDKYKINVDVKQLDMVKQQFMTFMQTAFALMGQPLPMDFSKIFDQMLGLDKLKEEQAQKDADRAARQEAANKRWKDTLNEVAAQYGLTAKDIDKPMTELNTKTKAVLQIFGDHEKAWDNNAVAAGKMREMIQAQLDEYEKYGEKVPEKLAEVAKAHDVVSSKQEELMRNMGILTKNGIKDMEKETKLLVSTFNEYKDVGENNAVVSLKMGDSIQAELDKWEALGKEAPKSLQEIANAQGVVSSRQEELMKSLGLLTKHGVEELNLKSSELVTTLLENSKAYEGNKVKTELAKDAIVNCLDEYRKMGEEAPWYLNLMAIAWGAVDAKTGIAMKTLNDYMGSLGYVNFDNISDDMTKFNRSMELSADQFTKNPALVANMSKKIDDYRNQLVTLRGGEENLTAQDKELIASFEANAEVVKKVSGENDSLRNVLKMSDQDIAKLSDTERKNALSKAGMVKNLQYLGDALGISNEDVLTLYNSFETITDSSASLTDKLGAMGTMVGTVGGVLGNLGIVSGATAARMKTVGAGISSMASGIKDMGSGNPFKMLAGGIKILSGLGKVLKGLFGGDKWGKRAKKELEGLAGVTKDMQEKLKKTAKELGSTEKAMNKLIAEFIRDAAMLNEADFSTWGNKVIGMMNKLKKTSGPAAAELAKQVGDAFTELKNKADQLGLHGSKSMVNLIQKARELKAAGKDIPEVFEYVNEKLTAGADALSTYLGTFGNVKDLNKEIAEINEKLSNTENAEEALELQKELEEKTLKLQGVSQDVAANWDFMQTAALSTFAAMQDSGKSFIETVGVMGDQLSTLSEMAEANGLEVSEGLKQMTDMAAFIKNHKDLADRIDSTNKMMQALGDTSYMTANDFTNFSTNAQKQFQQLMDAGASEKEALMMLGPQLENLIKYSKTYGFTIDEQTMALMRKAKEEGAINGKSLSDAERQIQIQERMADILARIAEKFGVHIPKAMNDMAAGAENSFGRISTQTGQWARGLDDVEIKLRNGLPSAVDNLDKSYQDAMTGHSIVTETLKWQGALDGVNNTMGTDLINTAGELNREFTGVMEKATNGMIKTDSETLKTIQTYDQLCAKLKATQQQYDALDQLTGTEKTDAQKEELKTLKTEIDNIQKSIDDTRSSYTKKVEDLTKSLTEDNIDIDNFANYVNKSNDIFVAMRVGALTAKQAQETLGDTFSKLTQKSKELGIEGSREMLDLIQNVRTSGLEVGEVQEYVNDQLKSGVDALGSYMATFKDSSAPLKAELDTFTNALEEKQNDLDRYQKQTEKKNKELAELYKIKSQRSASGGDPMEQKQIDEHIKQLEKEIKMREKGTEIRKEAVNELNNQVNAQQERMDAATGVLQSDFESMGTYAVAMFNSLMAEGASFSEAMQTMGPQLTELSKIAQESGAQVSGPLKEMLDMQDFLDQNKEVSTRIDSTTKMLESLGNIGYLTADVFSTFQKDAAAQFDALKTKTGDVTEKYKLMGPELGKLAWYASQYGYELDSNTKKMIEEAKQSGVNMGVMIPPQEKMVSLMEQLVTVMGGKIPYAMEKMATSAEGAMGTVTKETENAQQALSNVEGTLTNELPAAVDILDKQYTDLSSSMTDITVRPTIEVAPQVIEDQKYKEIIAAKQRDIEAAMQQLESASVKVSKETDPDKKKMAEKELEKRKKQVEDMSKELKMFESKAASALSKVSETTSSGKEKIEKDLKAVEKSATSLEKVSLKATQGQEKLEKYTEKTKEAISILEKGTESTDKAKTTVAKELTKIDSKMDELGTDGSKKVVKLLEDAKDGGDKVLSIKDSLKTVFKEGSKDMTDYTKNTGLQSKMVTKLFGAMQNDVKEKFESIKAKTGDANEAYKKMGPELLKLAEFAKKNGIQLDENTQKLIAEAEQHKESMKKMIPGQEELNTKTSFLKKIISGDISGAFKDMKKTAEDSLKGIQTETTEWKQSLDKVQGQLENNLPGAVKELDKKYKDAMTGHSIVTETKKWKGSLDEVQTILGKPLLEKIEDLNKKYTHVSGDIYQYLKDTSTEGYKARLTIDQMVGELKNLQDAYNTLAQKRKLSDKDQNVMEDYKRKIEELSKALEESLPTIENYQKKFGELKDQLTGKINVSSSLISLAKDIRGQGKSFKELDEAIASSLESGSKGMADWVSALGPSSEDIEEIKKLREEYKDLMEKTELSDEEKERVKKLTGEVDSLTTKSKQNIQTDMKAIMDSQDIMVTYFLSMQAEGKNLTEIMDVMGDSFKAVADKSLNTDWESIGVPMSETFAQLYDLQQKMSKNEGLIKGIEGLKSSLHGIGDSMLYMSEDTFGTFERSALSAFSKLKDAGFDQTQSLQMIAPMLKDLEAYATQYGYALSGPASKLLKNAKDSKLIQAEQKSDTEKLVEANEKLATVMENMVAVFTDLKKINPFEQIVQQAAALNSQLTGAAGTMGAMADRGLPGTGAPQVHPYMTGTQYISAASGYNGVLAKDTWFRLHKGELVNVWSPEETQRLQATPISKMNLSDTRPSETKGDIVFEHITIQSENGEEAVREFMTALKANKFGVKNLIRKVAQ